MNFAMPGAKISMDLFHFLELKMNISLQFPAATPTAWVINKRYNQYFSSLWTCKTFLFKVMYRCKYGSLVGGEHASFT